jgi:hypothetical protein
MKKTFKPFIATLIACCMFVSAYSLPCITYYYFTATKNGSCAVDLQWKYQQCGSGKFYVEYMPGTGSMYVIAVLNSTGGGGSDETYNYTDNYACPGVNPNSPVQYRVRFISDASGNSDYTPVRAIDMGDACSCANNHTTRCNGISSSIVGSNAICAGSSRTYTLTGGYPANWTITSGAGLVSSSSANPYEITITNSSSSGSIVLSATIMGCLTYNKTIYLETSAPAVTNFPLMIYSGPGDENEVCQGDENIFYGDISANSTITWTNTYSSPGGFSYSPWGYDDLYLYMWKPNQTVIIRLDATNSCGTTTYDFAFKTIDCGFRYMVSPNPSKGDITIVRSPAAKKLIMPNLGNRARAGGKQNDVEVNIYDVQRNLRFHGKYKEGTINLRNTGLKAGNYFVVIKSGAYSETHQLLIHE